MIKNAVPQSVAGSILPTLIEQTGADMGGLPRFSIEPPRTGQANMAIDSAWLNFAEKTESPFTFVRFYRWNTPTASFGRHQDPSVALAYDYCKENDIPVVRRPTGGRAVLHGNEVTYAVISNDLDLFPVPSILETYCRIAEGLKLGFDRLGIQTTLSPGGRVLPATARIDATKPCFSSPSKYELLCGSRKLAGSAQHRLKRSFLQHGSIPIEIDYGLMSRALGFDRQSLQDSMISVSEASGGKASFEQVAECLAEGFQDLFKSC